MDVLWDCGYGTTEGQNAEIKYAAFNGRQRTFDGREHHVELRDSTALHVTIWILKHFHWSS